MAKLAELNDDRDPLLAFDENLHEAISEWRDDGDSINLGIDFNGDVRDASVVQFFSSLNMREVLIDKHGKDGPETYDNGSKPVDGIFVSSHININGGGYLEFGTFSDTDHRALWIDVPAIKIFGSRQQTLPFTSIKTYSWTFQNQEEVL